MARARNIKPGFFRNADLVDLPFEARLLFIGLWTLADRAGRLEDKTRQIKIEIFPADNVDCDSLIDLICKTGMLERYEVDGARYLQVVNFAKHQNPHRDEKASTIPVKPEHYASTVQTPCKPQLSTVSIVLNPESGSLIPDSLIPDCLTRETAPRKRGTPPVAKPIDVDQQTWEDWTALRIKKRATVSQTVIDESRLECAKAGISLDRFLKIWCMRGSQGLQADWLKPKEINASSGETTYQRSMRERVMEFSPSIARQAPGVYPLKNMILEDENVTTIAGH
jgi:hypothetical protein